MGLTLLEASKQNDGQTKRQAVIEMFANSSDLLRVLPFINIPGGSLAYNVEGSLPGVAFRGYNETFSASYGVINPQVEVLRIAGGLLEVDEAMIKTRGEDVRNSQEAMKVKALALHIADTIINGNSLINGREFDGLRQRVTGAQLVAANLTAPGSSSPLSLDALDAAIDSVDGPTHLVMSKAMRRKLWTAARAGVGGDMVVQPDDFGFRVTSYNDLPIVIADYNDLGQRIIDFDETGPDDNDETSSIYVVHFGDGYVSGLQNGTMDVRDLGVLSPSFLTTYIEWLVGLAVMHGRGVARVWGITDAAVTV